MARKVFYSFNYAADFVRASAVRTLGIVEGNPSAPEKDWAALVKAGEVAIQRWIDGQLAGRVCTIVLIGANTAGRRWIKYEVDKSWNEKKGVLGIHIHNLKDAAGTQSPKGKNPFEDFTLKREGVKMSTLVKAYDPPPTDARAAANYISLNLAKWVEEAIRIRANY